MNRITPEQVVEAYRTSGIQPVWGIWGRSESAEMGKCGCALTALTASKVGFDEGLKGIMNHRPFDYIRETLGYERDYIEGFVYGFDGLSELSYKENTFLAGYYDGTLARQVVQEEFGDKFVEVDTDALGDDEE